MNVKKITLKSKILLSILFITYKITFEIFYIMYISEQFGYYGSILNINIIKMIESYVWFILILVIIPKTEKKVSSIIIQLHFVLIIIPILNIYWLKNEASIFLRVVCIVFILQIMIIKYCKNIKVPKIKSLFYINISIVILVSSYVLVYFIKYMGLPSLTALNLHKVYEIRNQLKLKGVINYLMKWQVMVINPFFIMIFFKKRKYIASGIISCFHIMLFLWTGHKTFLFILPMIVLSAWLIKKQTLIKILTSMFIIIIPISHIAQIINPRFDMLIAIVHRFFISPATNQFYYFDFFESNSKLYWSNGLIGKIFKISYPYDKPIGTKLGEIYYQREQMNVTTGYLADGFANAGMVGIILYVVIFAILLKFIDSISKKIGVPFTVGMLIFIMISLTDTALLTTLLTSGMLLAILLIYSYDSFT